ncbi:MAG: HD domain-containing protein [Gemmatimonadaceae bacterium]
MDSAAQRIVQSYALIDRLKGELRHSWLSTGRRESVAEHTWGMCLLACLAAPHLEHAVDLERTLKMIIVHDLIEAITGDIPFFEESARKANKVQAERQAMREIADTLPPPAAGDLHALWLEYEDGATHDARFARALDSLEVQLQHNHADLQTWEPVEYGLVYSKMAPRCHHDTFLSAVCRLVEQEGEQRMVAHGVDVEQVKAAVETQRPHGVTT